MTRKHSRVRGGPPRATTHGKAGVDLVVLDLDRGTAGTDVCRSMATEADGEYVSMADVPPSERTRVVTRVIESVR